MAKVLCVTSGLTSLLYASVELGRRLDAAGHDITMMSAPEAAEMARDHGLAFIELEPSGYQKFLEADRPLGPLARLRTLDARRQRALNSLRVDSFVETVRAHRPDLLLIDGEMHEHIIAASEAGVRMALLVAFVSIWKRPGLPPPHTLVRPGVGWRGSRLGIRALWMVLALRKWWRRRWLTARDLGCDRVSLLHQLAREVGFDLRLETDTGQWLIPFTYTRLPALNVHALEFDFPHVPPPGVHYLGPMVLTGRRERGVSGATQTELESVFARRRGDDGRRLIYAGFGSFFTADVALVSRLCEAVTARPDWDLVVSLGGRTPLPDLGAVPSNVHLLPWVPQLEVLRHADVAVVHGGIGTVEECIASRVPMLVYCGFETDMGGNAARVWHHGVGVVGDPRDSPEKIRARIDHLLSDSRFATNLARLSAHHAAYTENRVAEGIIQSLVAP